MAHLELVELCRVQKAIFICVTELEYSPERRNTIFLEHLQDVSES